MKKFITAITILTFAIAMFAVVSLTACDSGSNNGKIKITSAMFNDYHVDLSGSQGLGIVKTDETKTQNKNYMVTLNEDGSLKDVVFLSDNNKTTTQEQIEGSIAKLHITERFTFMMFSIYDNVQSGMDFNRERYLCNKGNQSFVIDNTTGKIYSLEEVCSGISELSIEEDYVIITSFKDILSYNYFALSIQNENLVFTNLSPNSTIMYKDFILDKFGNYYIGISSIDEKIDNLYYYTYYGDFNKAGSFYGKGNDGYVYKVNTTKSFTATDCEITVKKMGANFEEIDLEPNAAVTINLKSNYDKKTILIKGEKMFHVQSVFYIFASYEGGKYINEKDTFSTIVFAFLGQETFYIRDYKLYHYDWLTETETLVLDGTNDFVNEGTRVYVNVESVTGTKKYEITFIDGEAGYTLDEEKTYDRTIITIQPLN